VDGTKGYLKTQITYSPDPSAEKAGLLEEKEAARKAITEKKPLLLKEPQDFSDFYKFGGKDRKLSSHMSIPFGFQGKVMGTLSLSLLNGKRHFTERDLQFLLIFSNHACIALQHHHLIDEIRKATILRKSYEHYLDDLSGQLQNLSVGERRRIDDHIVKFLSGLNPEKKAAEYQQGMVSAGGNGVIRLVGEMRFEGDTEPLPEKVMVEIEGRSGRANIDLNNAGVFIPTPYPRDLGEQFFLKLHLLESQPVELPCKVIFTNKYGKESENLRRGMGIKFIDPPPEIQKLFDEYLQAQKDGETPPKKEARSSSESAQPSEAKEPKEEEPSSLPLNPTPAPPVPRIIPGSRPEEE